MKASRHATPCSALRHTKLRPVRGRLAYLGLVDSGLEVPSSTDRQDIAAALGAVASTNALFLSRTKIPAHSAKWTSDDGAVMTYHMHKAAGVGDVAGMERLESLGTPVSAPLPPWSDTPLHTAARFDQVEALEWLLSRGARVQARTVEGWTPLMMGAVAASDRVVAALLAKGARPDTRGIPPVSLDALDCCDLAGLERSSALPERLTSALEATGAAATGAPAAGSWLHRRAQAVRSHRFKIQSEKFGVQVTARMPLSSVERWETGYGAGKGGRESGYAAYDPNGGGMVPRHDGDPNRLGHKKRSQLDSMQLLHFRRTQLAKTGVGRTYDTGGQFDAGDAPDKPHQDSVAADLTLPVAHAFYRADPTDSE